MTELELPKLVVDFAEALARADAKRPVALSTRSGKSYRPGIGPHSESETLKLVIGELLTSDAETYASHRLNVPYGDDSRQTCDLCLGDGQPYDWAIEAKLLRLMGDNGKPNDAMLTHILSPYPHHRSALTDCSKLANVNLARHSAVLIFGYDFLEFSLDPAVDAFESLARRAVQLGSRQVAPFDGLIHPVHQRGRVFAWEILGRL